MNRLDILKTLIKVKNKFCEEKEMRDTMKDFYQIKRNLITSYITLKISFLKRTISISFVRSKTFDRGFVRGEYNDLKFCRHLLLSC